MRLALIIKTAITIFLIFNLMSGCSSKIEFSERLNILNKLNKEENIESKTLVFYQADSLLVEISDSLDMSDSLYVELLFIKAKAARIVKSDSIAIILFDSLKSNEYRDIKRNPVASIMPYIISGHYYTFMKNNDSLGNKNISEAIRLSEECGEKCLKLRGNAITQFVNILKHKKLLDSALHVAIKNRNFLKYNYPDYFRGLGLIDNTIGTIYHDMGNNYLAEQYYKLAEEIYQKDSPILKLRSSSLGSLGWLYLDNKEYKKAFEKFQEAKFVAQKTRPFDDYVSLRVSAGYAQTLLHYGNNSYCISLIDSILEVIGESGPKDALSETIFSLSNYYFVEQDYVKALKYINESITLFPENISSLHYKSLIVIKMQDMQLARQLLDSALEISSKKYGLNNFKQLPILIDLLKIKEKENKVFESDSLIMKIENITMSIDGYTNLKAESIEEIAQYYRRRGKFNSSIVLLLNSIKLRHDALNTILVGSSENWTIKYAKSLHKSVNLLISTAIEAGVDYKEYSSQIVNSILSSKGILSESLLQRNIRRNSFKKNLTKKENERLKELSSIISSFYMGSEKFTLLEILNFQHEYDEIVNKSRKNDSQYKSLYKKTITNLKIIKDRLNLLQKNLLEFYSFFYIDNNDNILGRKYISFFIDNEGNSFLSEPIEAKEIDKLVDDFMNAMTKIASNGKLPNKTETSSIKLLSTSLYQMLVPQVLKNNLNINDLIIASDSKLNLFPFEAMFDGEKYLIERYSIEYILSGREILPKDRYKKNKEGILVLADPVITYLLEEENLNQPDFVNMQQVDCYDFKSFVLKELPFAKKEALFIESKINDLGKGESVDLYYKEEATEKLFSEEGSKYRVIHIAAHGFYIPDSCYNTDKKKQSNSRFSLSRSGIILAKSQNSVFDENKFIEDGRLTALEVSMMNLTGVELVTLASCESGVGDVTNGEGIYGLRRAFIVAGVSTVVSSLWPLDDKTSTKFIGEIYSSGGGSLARKLQKSKIKLIKQYRKNGLPDHPFIWAPYIVYGIQ